MQGDPYNFPPSTKITAVHPWQFVEPDGELRHAIAERDRVALARARVEATLARVNTVMTPDEKEADAYSWSISL
jgi:hypothetical protein